MMTRRAFSCAGLWTGVLAMLGLSSCESPAPVEDLVAGEDLFSVGYSYGGGMDGGTDSIELTRDRGAALATRTRKETWNGREKTTKKRLDAAVFVEFEQLVVDFDLRAASECPDSELIALDAPTTSVTFAYVDEDGGMEVDGMFTVSSQQDIDDLQREGFRKACAMLKQLAGD